MNRIICSIFDAKAEAWLMPMFFQATGQAIRSFGDAINSDSEFGKHPEDYSLWRLGTFDERDGKILVDEVALVLVRGIDMERSGQI